jgi:hypothetical protein
MQVISNFLVTNSAFLPLRRTIWYSGHCQSFIHHFVFLAGHFENDLALSSESKNRIPQQMQLKVNVSPEQIYVQCHALFPLSTVLNPYLLSGSGSRIFQTGSGSIVTTDQPRTIFSP